jgi:hypothetical protein
MSNQEATRIDQPGLQRITKFFKHYFALPELCRKKRPSCMFELGHFLTTDSKSHAFVLRNGHWAEILTAGFISLGV